MALLYTQDLDAFCIASSDADFTPLIMQMKANGHEVYGFGARKTPDPFVNACTTFVYLESLGDDPVAAEPEIPSSEPPKIKSPGAAKSSEASKVAKADLAKDKTLVTILRGAVDAAAWDDGWASMAAAGSAAKRQSSIDPRNYGVKNFPQLFQAIGLFDIFKDEGGQSIVADKQNSDRDPRPTR